MSSEIVYACQIRKIKQQQKVKKDGGKMHKVIEKQGKHKNHIQITIVFTEFEGFKIAHLKQ